MLYSQAIPSSSLELEGSRVCGGTFGAEGCFVRRIIWRPQMRRTCLIIAAAGAALSLAACGHTTEQKAATGAVAGAVVAGPVGAAVGGAGGAVVGKATDGK